MTVEQEYTICTMKPSAHLRGIKLEKGAGRSGAADVVGFESGGGHIVRDFTTFFGRPNRVLSLACPPG